MALLKKTDITRPVVPKETVPVPALGGDVVVRGLMLSERLGLYASRAGRDGKALLDVPEILALCVLDGDGLPVFDVTEWDAFGIKNGEAALQLFNVARRLSGLDAEDAKKN